MVDPSGTSDNKLGDFTDKNTTADDYGYDKNGNLITDLNKKLNGSIGIDYARGGAIVYNYMNLPWQITPADSSNNVKGTITYIYDATGNKLEKRINELASTYNNNVAKQTTTGYLGNYVYENNVLQFLGQEEGRIREKRDVNGVLQGYMYDYFWFLAPSLAATPASAMNGGAGGTITWDPSGANVWVTGGGQDNNPTTNLMHELFHGEDANNGLLDSRLESGLKRDEWQATYRENIVRQQIGAPTRAYYRSQDNGGIISPLAPSVIDASNNPIMPSWVPAGWQLDGSNKIKI